MGRRRRQRSPAPGAPPGPPAPRVLPIGRWLGAAGLGVLAAATAAWLYFTHPRPRPNVLLITIDTLRADHVGVYGDRDAETPVLDALAGRGVRALTAVAHAPLTAVSHASILTGLTPLRHGVRDNGSYVLPDSVPTLAEAFGKAGYRTAAVISGFPLDRRFGLARGFETYDDRLPHGDDPRRAAYVERPADQTTAAVVRGLEAFIDGTGNKAPAQSAAPWFLWVHYFDPHAPYEPPGDFARRFSARPYDGEIAFVDREIGRLLSWLDGHGLRDRTLVLVTADHGESLGEHGEETHGVFIYDSTLRVPWIVAGPGIPSGRITTTVVRGEDDAPTLLDLAGLPLLRAMDGRSVREAVLGGAMPDAPAYCESLFVKLNLGWAPLHGWRTAQWKLVEAPRPELYALETDAGETRDRSADRSDVAGALRRDLQAALSTPTPNAASTADAEAQERLRSLGYIGGQATVSKAIPRDPKDQIALVNQLERAIAEARARPTHAAAELAAVLAQDPSMVLARRFRAIALSMSGDFEGAVREVRVLDRDGTAASRDLVLLGECLRLAGRSAEAVAVLERAARQDPRAPEPLLNLARVHMTLGRNGDAAALFERVAAMVPGHSEALRGLGDLATARGDLDSAERYYRQLVGADPRDTGAKLHLGVLAVRRGRLEEAVALFRDLVDRDPRNAEALLTLGGALAKSGRPAEAVPYFERAVEAGARSTVALNSLGFARLESGDEAGGAAALRQSLSLNPSQPKVREVLSSLTRGRSAPGPGDRP